MTFVLSPAWWVVTERQFVGVQILRFANGKIVDDWEIWDQLGMMQQMGLLPAPAPGPVLGGTSPWRPSGVHSGHGQRARARAGGVGGGGAPRRGGAGRGGARRG